MINIDKIEKNSGIYKILCKNTGKFYIGSDFDIKRRIKEHLTKLKCEKHCNPILQNIYLKYGKNSLVVEIVEFCDRDILKDREQYYINTLYPYINISPTATGGCVWLDSPNKDIIIEKIRKARLGKSFNHTEETKKKISKSHQGKIISEKTREKLRNINLGKKYSKEICEKKSISIINALKNPKIKNKMKINARLNNPNASHYIINIDNLETISIPGYKNVLKEYNLRYNTNIKDEAYFISRLKNGFNTHFKLIDIIKINRKETHDKY